MKFTREPAAWLGFLGAVLTVLVTFNLKGLSSEQAALISAALAAIVGAVQAALVRPIAPAAFTAAVAALAALVAGYGLELPPELVGAVQAAVVAFLSLGTVRSQVTPKADQAPTTPDRGTVR